MGIGPELGGDWQGATAPWGCQRKTERRSVTRPLVADFSRAADRRPGSARGRWVDPLAHLGVLATLLASAAVLLAIDSMNASAYASPTLRATAETVMTLLAFAGALLCRARFNYSGRGRDLLLFAAFAMLAATTLFARAVPAALGKGAGSEFAVAALWADLFVAAAFAGAALAPPDRLITRGRPVVIVAMSVAFATAIAELGGLVLREPFVGAGGRLADAAAQRPLAVAFELLTAGLLLCAAISFASRSRGEDAGVWGLLAAGMALLAAASLSHLGFALTATHRSAPREAVRLLAFASLMAAALREEFRARKGLAQAAAIAERRRVAQDLHDGLAQDLAFIAAHSARIADPRGSEHPVALAARRALATSRSTIAELSDPAAANTKQALDALAYELRDRFGISIAVDAEADAEVASDDRDQIARIAREAIANAARHGGAKNVVVSLKRTYRGTVLRVVDDGSGIVEGHGGEPREGFGLRCVREQAASLGGQATVRRPGKRGTELEVVLP